MTSGGHARSGPAPDPNSLKSAKRGLVYTALPSEGYAGEVPEFPLPTVVGRGARELALWAWAWRTPQASAWFAQPWRWYSVALWVRTAVICESADATAADKNSLHRFADQIGLTPAGLKENGWKIAADQVAAKRDAQPTQASAARTSTRDRLKAIDGGKSA